MDDKYFGEADAQEWIATIEDPKAKIREQDIYPAMQSWIVQNKPQNIIDIGCGQGSTCEYIAAEIEYVGIEPSPFLRKRAHNRYPQTTHRKIIEGNAYALPVADKTFDAAVSFAVWHLLENLDLAAKELSRVLKTKSHFFIVTGNSEMASEWVKLYSSFDISGNRLTGVYQGKNSESLTDTLYLHSKAELTQSFENHGLHVHEIKPVRTAIMIFGGK